MLWSLILSAVVLALSLPALGFQQTIDEEGEIARRFDPERWYFREVRKRGLLALTRFKPFSMMQPTNHKYTLRSGIDPNTRQTGTMRFG